MLQRFVLTFQFSTNLALECSRPSTPHITHRARGNWLVSPPILSSTLNRPSLRGHKRSNGARFEKKMAAEFVREKSLQSKRSTSNRSLQMGFIWEIGLREYKSTHIDKSLNFLLQLKSNNVVTSVSHRSCCDTFLCVPILLLHTYRECFI